MAQCFVSSYRDHYRWQDPVKTPSAKIPEDQFTKAIPPELIWYEASRDVDNLDLEGWEKRLHRSCLKRYITTYQQSFCKNQVAKFVGDRVGEPQEAASEAFENQLLQSSRDLYEAEHRPKIAPPLPGTRKVLGYIRPSRNYTPLTNYQHFYGKTAYKILIREEGRKLIKRPENKEVQENQNSEDGKKEYVESGCHCNCSRRVEK